jgi:hypothetical protein
MLTEAVLRDLYIEREFSLQDIAEAYGCTSPYVQYLMKRSGIPRRTKSQARRIAQRDGKIRYKIRVRNGSICEVTPHNTTIDRGFFRTWTAEMAYVLGVLFSDGCMSVSPRGYRQVSITQKEPELLRKCLQLMECDAPLKWAEQGRESGIHRFNINDQQVCGDLVALGMHPRKSRTIQFPAVPSMFVRHFIRGCWDGDGSVFKSGKTWGASYISGSLALITGIHEALVVRGMPRRTIHRHRSAHAYTMRWTGTSCAMLFSILYFGAPETCYLARKYVKFREAASPRRLP